MRDLVPTETLAIKVLKVVGQDTKILEFSTHSTISEDNYGMVKVTQNHNLSVTTPISNQIFIKYHWFIDKMYSGWCSVNMMDVKDQKANIFTRGLQGGIFLHIRKFLCG